MWNIHTNFVIRTPSHHENSVFPKQMFFSLRNSTGFKKYFFNPHGKEKRKRLKCCCNHSRPMCCAVAHCWYNNTPETGKKTLHYEFNAPCYSYVSLYLQYVLLGLLTIVMGSPFKYLEWKKYKLHCRYFTNIGWGIAGLESQFCQDPDWLEVKSTVVESENCPPYREMSVVSWNCYIVTHLLFPNHHNFLAP